jgi:MFS family permease
MLVAFGSRRTNKCADVIARYFGRKHFTELYGLTWTAYAVGGATGPVVVGRFYDRYGMYQPGLIFALALTCVAGAALSLVLPRHLRRLRAC